MEREEARERELEVLVQMHYAPQQMTTARARAFDESLRQRRGASSRRVWSSASLVVALVLLGWAAVELVGGGDRSPAEELLEARSVAPRPLQEAEPRDGVPLELRSRLGAWGEAAQARLPQELRALAPLVGMGSEGEGVWRGCAREAHEHHGPPGGPLEVLARNADELRLDADTLTRMEVVFESEKEVIHRLELGVCEELEVLRQLTTHRRPERAKITAQVERLSRVYGALNERRVSALESLRGLLTLEQLESLQAFHERRDASRFE